MSQKVWGGSQNEDWVCTDTLSGFRGCSTINQADLGQYQLQIYERQASFNAGGGTEGNFRLQKPGTTALTVGLFSHHHSTSLNIVEPAGQG